jgi:outer membrane biosynthesis protein TonB
MVTAKCNRCHGSADGKTMQEARSKINHAQGKSRGIPCGNSYNCVVEVKSSKPVEEPKVETKSVEKPKEETKSVEKPITSKPESSKSTPKKSKYS